MNARALFSFARPGAATVAAIFSSSAVFAADISPDSLKFASGVVNAPACETPGYIVANSANLYSELKGWWVLVGKDGTGIGYVPISMLSPADKYVP
jgi:hypothetical protein